MELRAAYEQNIAENREPYERVHIQTMGELLWICRERGWSGNQLGNERQRVQLAHAEFARTNLQGVHLLDADFREADFTFANLGDAGLMNACLYGAKLQSANLSGALLWFAQLEDANLQDANLASADLLKSDLSGADMSGAYMDATTRLAAAQLDSRTLLADVVWNGVPLTGIAWERVEMLGDERQAHHPDAGRESEEMSGYGADPTKEVQTGKARRIGAYLAAVRANRQLAVALRAQGLNDPRRPLRLPGTGAPA